MHFNGERTPEIAPYQIRVFLYLKGITFNPKLTVSSRVVIPQRKNNKNVTKNVKNVEK